MNLYELGWNDFFQANFAQYNTDSHQPARVVRRDRLIWTVRTETDELTASPSGKFRHDTTATGDWPAVGDWVVIIPRSEQAQATIHALLPRQSCFARKAASSGGNPDAGGRTDQQVLVANINTVFLVSDLDRDFNVRRMERYLLTAYDSGATPVIILNKADLCENAETHLAQIEAVALGVDTHVVSATESTGLEPLNQYLGAGQTVALLGSSGVGKSTIINALLGTEHLATGAVRDHDGRGRHTTTHRELIVMPPGGILIDTPGMRELQIWADEDSLKQAFDDIDSLARNCRFRDCRHHAEPGCAVAAAVQSGDLESERLESFHKLQKEMRRLEERQSGMQKHMDKIRGRQFASRVNEAIRHKLRRR